ncbi:MAG: uroporphyrinogen decarboxylase family protein [Spirochaetota bacterium]
MTELERFKEVMENFNTRVASPKWEFGYWGATIDNWYAEGLPQKKYPEILTAISTPSSSLYTPCWKSIKSGRLPAGIAVLGGGLYYPTQGFVQDFDVRDCLHMDRGQQLVDVNLLFDPVFEVEMLEEDDEFLVYVDLDGVTRKFAKRTGVIPTALKNVITSRKSWEKLKAERINLKDISGRFPANWDELVKEYRNRDYPLVLGGYPHGLFGTEAHLMGYEHLFYNYSDDPRLIHDINRTFTELWLSVFSEVLSQTSVDMVVIWEDMSSGTGSMVSPAMIREFMSPYYRRITGFLKARGIETIFIDTDGYCFDLIPVYMEAGITGMYPIEASCGMDVVRVRKTFPTLKMMGGIPKYEIRYGKKRIDEILEPVQTAYKLGGYIPFGDHLIPPEVHWNDFKYYRERLNNIIDHSMQT